MGFWCITGTMGSGKSYFGMELCAQAFREGAVVHTNIDVIAERIIEEGWGAQFVPLGDNPHEWQPLIKAGEEGRENLVVIDEGMLLFDALDWQANAKKHKVLIEFLVWSRKLGLDVYMIGQAQKGMDVKFTRMSQAIYHCVAVKKMFVIGPWWASIRGDFLRVEKSPDGQVRGDKHYRRFDPFVGGLYRTDSTHGKFQDVERVVMRKPRDDKRAARFAWLKFAALVGVVVGGLWAAQALAMKALQPPERRSRTPEPPAPVARLVDDPPPAAAVAPPVAPAPPPRPAMRLWGACQGLEFWEAGTGRRIALGGAWDDQLIVMVRRHGRIFTVTLEDGASVRFRPAERADAAPIIASSTQPAENTWKKFLSSEFTFPPSLRDLGAPSSGTGAEK